MAAKPLTFSVAAVLLVGLTPLAVNAQTLIGGQAGGSVQINPQALDRLGPPRSNPVTGGQAGATRAYYPPILGRPPLPGEALPPWPLLGETGNPRLATGRPRPSRAPSAAKPAAVSTQDGIGITSPRRETGTPAPVMETPAPAPQTPVVTAPDPGASSAEPGVAPGTAAPSAAAPSTPMPVTPGPVTPGPATAAPASPAPSDTASAPSSAPPSAASDSPPQTPSSPAPAQSATAPSPSPAAPPAPAAVPAPMPPSSSPDTAAAPSAPPASAPPAPASQSSGPPSPASPVSPATPPAAAPAPPPSATSSNPAAQQSAMVAPRPTPSPAPQGGLVTIPFAAGQGEMPGASNAALDRLAQQLADTEDRLQIRAYAAGNNGADGGSGARRLALTRALAVRAYLIDKGIRSTRIDVRALGTPTDGSPADRVEVAPVGR